MWRLPTPGGPDDLDHLVLWFTGEEGESTFINRVLFAIRWKLGSLLGWDQPDIGAGSRVHLLRERLPEDLGIGLHGPDARTVPFKSVYHTQTEWVAEICNRTVHALMHIGQVGDDANGYYAEMTVLVKPNGRIGRIYMAAIKPCGGQSSTQRCCGPSGTCGQNKSHANPTRNRGAGARSLRRSPDVAPPPVKAAARLIPRRPVRVAAPEKPMSSPWRGGCGCLSDSCVTVPGWNPRELDPVLYATALFNLVGWSYVHLRTERGWRAKRAGETILDIAHDGLVSAEQN